MCKLKSHFLILLFISISFTLNNFLFAFGQDTDPIKLIQPIMLEARIDVPLELSLEKTLKLALDNNLDIKISRFEKDIQKWKLWENIGTLLPDYTLGFDERRLDGNFIVGGVFPIMALTSNVNAFMRFDYTVFDGGKKLFNVFAAKNLYQGLQENLSASINDLLFVVFKAYNRLLKEQAKLDVFKDSVEEANANLELNLNLEKEGVGTRFNVLEQEALLAEQEQSFIRQQAIFREASIYLAKLLNLEQGTHIKPDLSDLKAKEFNDIKKPINDLIELAKDKRHEIKNAKYRYSASKKYVYASYTDFLPKANIFGQYGGSGNVFFNRTKIRTVIPDAISLDENGSPIVQTVSRDRTRYQTIEPQIDLTNITSVSNVIRAGGEPFTTSVNDSLMANRFLGVEVGWDLAPGLGLETISRIKQTKKQREINKITIDKIHQDIEQEVRTAFLNVQAQQELLKVADKRLNAAGEALRLAKLRLENGVGINTELLNAQTQYTDALSTRVNAIIEYNNAQAELLHSLGIIDIDNLT